jgi:hypothetical protein
MSADSPSQLIDARIEELGDGREKTLARYGHEGGKIDEGGR